MSRAINYQEISALVRTKGAEQTVSHLREAIDQRHVAPGDFSLRELAEYLIEQAGVALVPGSAFGLGGHVRISIATSMANLEKALDRIAGVSG